ncbi:zinc-finger of the MIZ type in Nse subunit-domain-containing protein [Syncephalis fuscata]|nr:zinc-finger of the MIZ type in Nse subunit-domain-containing protein [Syncephalis fuscata]
MAYSTSGKLDALAREHEALAKCLQDSYSSFIECAYDLEEIDASEELKTVDKTFKELLKEEQKLRANANALQQISVNSIDNNEHEVISTENYDTQRGVLLERYLRQYGLEFSRHNQYKEFRQKIWEVKHPTESMPPLHADSDVDEDDDIIQVSQQISLICPLTTMIMENPVTNTTCNHSFSETAIMDYIRQQSRGTGVVNCPVAGCSQTVRANTLKANRMLERRIQRETEIKESQQRPDSEYTDIV